MRRKLQLMFIFICLSALIASGQGIGDRNRASGSGGGTYRITGRVMLPDGSPAVNADVSANSLDFSGSSTRTDPDGNFTLGGLSAGNYSVVVRQEGYQTETESLTISQGMTAGQGFQLVFYLRAPGTPKGARPVNPLLKDVPKDAVAKYNKGVEKMTAGDAKAAIPLFDEAIAAHPAFAAAYYEKGSALVKIQEYDKALESFVKAIESKPDYMQAKYSVGYTQYLKKNYEVAAAVFDDVLKQKSDLPEAQMYLGISLFNLKNVDAAAGALEKAVAAKGGDKLALAHLYLGQIYAQKGRNGDAVVELEKYLQMAPKAPNADRIKTAIADLRKKGST